MAYEIKITQVEVFPVKESQGKLRAFARVIINEQFALTNLRIYEGSDGILFVGFPLDPHHTGEDYRQLFYPLNKELRQHFDSVIVAQYKNTLQELANG